MTDDLPDPAAEVFTVGHSNHPPETFLDLLRRHAIEVVVDVRSSPYSGYAGHFNKEPLENLLRSAGIKYLFLGDVVGGRPQGAAMRMLALRSPSGEVGSPFGSRKVPGPMNERCSVCRMKIRGSAR